MYEGKIISFYRKRAKLTQDKLGHGICSKSHVSKIENGQADYSSEIITLLSERLGINMVDEIHRYKSIRKLLHSWNEAMISKRNEEVDSIKEKLNREKLITISDYQVHYELLNARYNISRGNTEDAYKTIVITQKNSNGLSSYESNLLKHVSGIYYLDQKEYNKAVNILRAINIEDYNNPEYYYHLAVAYRQIDSYTKAYYFTEKSLRFFTKTNRFLRIIDAETLLLSLRVNVKGDDFEEIIKKYESLIHSCDLCNDKEGKIILMYNLAFEYFKRNKYETAGELFKQILNIKDSNHFLDSLNYYIRCCMETGARPKEELLSLTRSGLTEATETNNPLFIRVFTLLLYLLKDQSTKYYNYLERDAVPYFRENGYSKEGAKQFQEELLTYYLQTKQTDKALEMALSLLDFKIS